ncbi:MAG: extracellular solute-binding protein [Flavobacteriales bacterium TMED191]|nr:MAG: extracellular solute-binding protein [Flavobacteriales bacterium TMED191]
MKKSLLILLFAMLFSCSNKNKQKEVLNIYSKRHYQVDKDLFKKFEEENNITVNVVKASSDELIERIKTEGKKCPADLLITVDAGKLYKAANDNLLAKININEISKNIKSELIDANGYWLPITYRARVIAYNPRKVNSEELSTYEDLTNEKWKNRILVRTSTNSYNQALLSSIVAHHGEDFALNWCNNLVDNFARKPKGNDRDQIRAIAANIGDIAIVNSYYIGLLQSSPDSLDRHVGQLVEVFFPNQAQNERGAHINISGIGLLKNSPNKDNAIKFMKFLTSEYAQTYYTNNSFEYPVIKNIKPSNTIAKWGDFKIDSLNLNELGIKRKQAVGIFEKSKWN